MIDAGVVKQSVSLESAFEFLGLDWPTQGRAHPQILCPFQGHEDTDPSCVLYPETDSVFCFGCSRGGDVIELVSLVKGWDFQHAVTELGDFHDVRDDYIAPKEYEPNPRQLFLLISDQAHADVLGWVRESPLASKWGAGLRAQAFEFYDEIMRAERAEEITREAAVKELLAWRLKWRTRLHG